MSGCFSFLFYLACSLALCVLCCLFGHFICLHEASTLSIRDTPRQPHCKREKEREVWMRKTSANCLYNNAHSHFGISSKFRFFLKQYVHQKKKRWRRKQWMAERKKEKSRNRHVAVLIIIMRVSLRFSKKCKVTNVISGCKRAKCLQWWGRARIVTGHKQSKDTDTQSYMQTHRTGSQP